MVIRWGLGSLGVGVVGGWGRCLLGSLGVGGRSLGVVGCG